MSENRDADLKELYSDPMLESFVEVERLTKAISLCRTARDELGRIADYWQGQALSAADRADMWCDRADAAEARVRELERDYAVQREAWNDSEAALAELRSERLQLAVRLNGAFLECFDHPSSHGVARAINRWLYGWDKDMNPQPLDRTEQRLFDALSAVTKPPAALAADGRDDPRGDRSARGG